MELKSSSNLRDLIITDTYIWATPQVIKASTRGLVNMLHQFHKIGI